MYTYIPLSLSLLAFWTSERDGHWPTTLCLITWFYIAYHSIQPGIAISNVQVRGNHLQYPFLLSRVHCCVYKFLYSELTEMDNPPVDHFQKAMDYQSVLYLPQPPDWLWRKHTMWSFWNPTQQSRWVLMAFLHHRKIGKTVLQAVLNNDNLW